MGNVHTYLELVDVVFDRISLILARRDLCGGYLSRVLIQLVLDGHGLSCSWTAGVVLNGTMEWRLLL